MKAKNTGKKLVFKKESIAMLTREEKWEVRGGVVASVTCTVTIYNSCYNTVCVNSQCSVDAWCITIPPD